MRIRTKLLSAFGAVALLAMAVHFFGIWTKHHLLSVLTDLVDRRMPVISGIALMRTHCSRMAEEAGGVLVARHLVSDSERESGTAGGEDGGRPGVIPSQTGDRIRQGGALGSSPEAEMEASSHASRTDWAQPSVSLADHKRRELVEEYGRGTALLTHVRWLADSLHLKVICDDVGIVLESTFRHALSVLDAPVATTGRALLAQIKQIEDQQVEAQVVLDAAVESARVELREMRDRMRITTRLARFLDVLGVVLVGGLSLGLGFLIAKRAERPIRELVRGATLLARGRHGVRIEIKGKDELAGLAESFNAMAQALEETTVSKDRLEEAVQALAAARSEALAATQAKTQFLANMSHEIRTPLNALLGFTELLKGDNGASSENERTEWLDIVHSSARHLLALVNDLLDISKIEAGKLELELMPCRVPELLSEIVSVYRPKAAEKGLELELRYSGALPATIRTDPTRLRQAVLNLLSNAVKFTTYGRVEISAGLIERDGRPMLCLQVLDTGPGIAAKDLDRMFDPFEQADASITRRFGGTGLGLAISRRIAEALGGSLTVQSEVGVGSCFTLEVDTGPLEGVDLLEAPVQESLLRSESMSTDWSRVQLGGSVLVVDDGEANSRLISVFLSRAGVEVTTAGNGKVAVELASRRRFDLILMDMQMPVMDGYTATRQLRMKGYDLPIIALTANALRGDESKCLAAGCNAYLTKPIEARRLLQTVAEVLKAPRPEVATTMTAETPNSTQVGAALHSALPVDDAEFASIVAEFVDRARERVGEMEQMLKRGERTELARLAHWLKGAGGTAGFDAFTTPAARLEDAARYAVEQELAILVNELRDISERLVKPGVETAGKLAQLDGMGI